MEEAEDGGPVESSPQALSAGSPGLQQLHRKQRPGRQLRRRLAQRDPAGHEQQGEESSTIAGLLELCVKLLRPCVKLQKLCVKLLKLYVKLGPWRVRVRLTL